MSSVYKSWSDVSQAIQLVHGAAYGSYLGVSALDGRFRPVDFFVVLFVSSLLIASLVSIPAYWWGANYRLAGRNVIVCLLASIIVFFVSFELGLNGYVFLTILGSWACLLGLMIVYGTESEKGLLRE